jgi:SAM-dependent methyltransferase
MPETPGFVEPAPVPDARARNLELFLISFVALFLELTCIRWFGSTVTMLTFFTNIVLMACVLGLSIGCLTAQNRRTWLGTVLPLVLLAVLAAAWSLDAFLHGRFAVDVGNQASPQHIYFGAERSHASSALNRTSIEMISGLFFGLIALMFVGIGQALGRAFDAITDRVTAYSVNILGSLAGVVMFAVASTFRLPPQYWFASALLPVLWFLKTRGRMWWPAALILAAILGVVTYAPSPAGVETIWSPYYKVDFSKGGVISTNNIGHQQMVKVGNSGSAYELSYLLNRDAGGPPREEVMIVGAGSGNDVAAALKHGVRHVDAVEIDPVLNELGRAHHPDRPYDDPRVSIHLDDGRRYVRKTTKTYDQIVYALVDSLMLHSGFSSIRLESFLFTEQAFADIRDRLRPDGVFVVYNYFRQGWVVGRLAKMAEKTFGTRPIVMSLPYRKDIRSDGEPSSNITLLMVGKSDSALAAIRKRFESGEVFWSHISPRFNASVNGFGTAPPEASGTSPEFWHKIAPAEVETAAIRWTPTDDWPFLYLRSPAIPWFLIRGMLIVAAISLVLFRCFAPVQVGRMNGQMFFLGAAFMLLETKGVVHLALLFGSTWLVSSVVISAVLVMILLSNLYVLAVKPERTGIYYGMLFAGLLANLAVPATLFLALPDAARVVVSCSVVFLPVFFAGIVFATAFRDSDQPDVDLGSNIAGVVLGGLSENLSLVVGFNGLLLIASGFYLLSLSPSRKWLGRPFAAARIRLGTPK